MMEKVATDDEDRPLQEIKIMGADIFVNPFQELEDQEKEQAAAAAKKADAGNPEDPDNLRSSWFTNPGAAATAAPVRSGVGKYIAAPVLDAPLGSNKAAAAADAAEAAASNGAAAAAAVGAGDQPAAKKQKVAAAKPMSNFDAW